MKDSTIKITCKKDKEGNWIYTASTHKIKNTSVYGHGKSPHEAIKDLCENLDIVLEYYDKWGNSI